MTDPIHPIPAAVAKAIVGVMSEVPKLAKNESNTHGNYNFASIDDFLEAVRPLCAKHNLVIIQDEDEVESIHGTDRNGKPTHWIQMRFSYILSHSSGETWAHPISRTIMTNAAMGSQAYGAAQSYSLKQFMRSIFQIATGEKGQDADENKPEDLPEQLMDWKAFGLTKTGAREQWAEVSRMIHAAESKMEIDGILTDHANIVEAIKQCSDTWPHCQRNIDNKLEEIENTRDVDL